MKSLQLLRQRRFLPFFLTQFSFAFNDNAFKTVLTLLLAFKASNEAESGLIASFAAALLIAPFFIFSPLAGQLADKFEKAKIIKIVKSFEILIMGVGSYGFYYESAPVLLSALFLLGTHSAFFGPAKFSILPQTFNDNELLSANALVELGTFLAILLGTIYGGYLSSHASTGIAQSMMILATAGWLCSLFIPNSGVADPNLSINLNPLTELWALYKVARSPRAIFLSILGISWFWFLGSAITIQLPAFTKYVLQADKESVTILLASFCISTAIGSLVCERLSDDEIEIGLVPIGAIGISIFFFDLAFADLKPLQAGVNLSELLWKGDPGYRRVLFDIFGMGFSGAFFIIPLNAFLQNRSDPRTCSRIIAANNIVNAVFMLGASLAISGMYEAGLSSTQIFAVLGFLNIAASIYMFLVIPEFTMRFIIWVLASTIYRVRYERRGEIPRHGPAVIVSNHVSFIDWFILATVSRRPVQFVMYYKFFEAPILKWMFTLGKAIPIAGAKEDPKIKARAFAKIRESLEDDQLIVIFPEGSLTADGELLPFRPGVEEIQKTFQTPVIPVTLKGLWGSYFSRSGGKALLKLPKPSRRVIRVIVGEPIDRFVPATELQEIIEKELKS